MLTTEQNERLTRVGKGTPMGTLLRRYWHPIALSTELPGRDSDPIVRKLLGERFVLFRDTEGRVGVMDEACLHRGASMALGRVEEGGIRCIYHGWKFDVTGKLLDTPNNPDPRFRERLRAKVYPVQERAGLVWTYIGRPELQPPFRKFAFEDVPDENRVIVRNNVPANYLQMWEGGADSSHVSILHSNVTRPGWLESSNRQLKEGDITDFIKPAWDDVAPKLEIEDTGFGYHYAALRQLGDGKLNVRLVPIFMPGGRIIPFPTFFNTVFEVPLDDEHTATYLVDASPTEKLSLEHRLRRSGLSEERFYKDLNFVASPDNGFWQDREAMREKRSWSGFHGITQEDAVMSVSMGPIYDRSREKLVAADAAVVKLRRLLLDALDRFESGAEPHGVNYADMTRMRGFDIDLGQDMHWRREAQPHAEHYPAVPA
ncbi:Rieske 2Fe-2S domain-containing protein [Variovorax sp. RA8]|uniref:Rieske 2Fe-2S domain-containing protein n=1 Tax=Variovorax sp. (strain JCM 16519 / RA8) TaxID=662548 RepID=UPI0013185C33|nr:Rieske 2Fe-2S domain-containing protein [Variovorax sp. RA8]VTU41574.1 Phthalate 4,5-dioxygenase oxygenase subunit [Variovorax sp. RA8]